MFCDLLEKESGANLSPRSRDHLQRIRDGVSRLRDLAEDLRRFTQLERSAIHHELTDVDAVVRRVRDSLASRIVGTGAEVFWDRLPLIEADGGLLEVVFQNLIRNAIRYRSSRAPRIEIAHERLRGRWRFSVRDNGIGIEEVDRERVFEPFERLDTKETGSGLGLAIVRSIVEAHGGEVTVDSEPGTGSVFRFTIAVPENEPGP
jgi:signal transduction histidine kinase